MKQLLRIILLILIIVAGSLIWLINRGTFDPQPIGREQKRWVDQRVILDSAEPQITWLSADIPQAYSIRLSARHQSSENSGYGLVIGNEQAHLGIAVSTYGFITLWEQADANTIEHWPWQPWVHVATGGTNEIWIDHLEDKITIWINREIFWQGDSWPTLQSCEQCILGLWGEALEDETIIFFDEVVLFAE